MFQSSDIIGPIPTHQRDIAQALQSSDYKLLQKERRSENGQPVCSDTLLSGLCILVVLPFCRNSLASQPDSKSFTFRISFRNAQLEWANRLSTLQDNNVAHSELWSLLPAGLGIRRGYARLL